MSCCIKRSLTYACQEECNPGTTAAQIAATCIMQSTNVRFDLNIMASTMQESCCNITKMCFMRTSRLRKGSAIGSEKWWDCIKLVVKKLDDGFPIPIAWEVCGTDPEPTRSPHVFLHVQWPPVLMIKQHVSFLTWLLQTTHQQMTGDMHVKQTWHGDGEHLLFIPAFPIVEMSMCVSLGRDHKWHKPNPCLVAPTL